MLADFPALYGPLVGALVAAALALVPLLRGPTDADRIVALDVLLAAAILLALVAALVSQRTVYLDVALGLAIVAFIATLGWARLIDGGGEQ